MSNNPTNQVKTFLVSDPQDYSEVVEYILSLLREKNILLLSGQVGAGKTFFVRKFLEHLNTPLPEMASPTFAFIHRYLLSTDKLNSSITEANHLDLYRLDSEDDLESIGFWDLFSRSHYLTFIEWPERVPNSWWPRGVTKIHIQIDKLATSESQRRVTISS